MAIVRVLGWALLAGIGGFVLAPLAVALVMLAFIAFDEGCNSPGDSGGCAMGVGVAVFAAAPLGFAGGVVIVVGRALWRWVAADPGPG